MKLFGKILVPPILLYKTSTLYGSAPDLAIRWRKSGSGGTMRTISYTLDIRTANKVWQWSFVWRPDVTRYYWKQRT